MQNPLHNTNNRVQPERAGQRNDFGNLTVDLPPFNAGFESKRNARMQRSATRAVQERVTEGQKWSPLHHLDITARGYTYWEGIGKDESGFESLKDYPLTDNIEPSAFGKIQEIRWLISDGLRLHQDLSETGPSGPFSRDCLSREPTGFLSGFSRKEQGFRGIPLRLCLWQWFLSKKTDSHEKVNS
jgi:hypothetical protein